MSTASTARPVTARGFLPVVSVAIFVGVLMATVINVLIPLMRAGFDVSAAQVGWVVTGFSLAYAIGVPLHGKFADFFGPRRVFCAGLVGFAAGGLVCALAPTLAVLIVGRIVQGAWSAALPAASFAAVAKVVPSGQRGLALGVIASSIGVGGAVGPIVGATVGQLAGWRALFYISLLMLVLVPFALRALPHAAAPVGKPRSDVASGVLLGVGAGLFLLGFTRGPEVGFASLSSAGSFLAAALALVGFVWRVNSVLHPFVPPALFRNRTYVTAVGIGLLAQLVNVAALVLVPLLVVEVGELPLIAAGLVVTPGAAAMAACSPVIGRISDRVGVRTPIVAGLTVMTLAALALSTLAGASPLLASAGTLGIGLGMALVQSPATNAASAALPRSEAGVGMGVFQGAFFFGGGAGAALATVVLAARQHATSGLNPLHTLDAVAYSDVFLAMAAAVLLALLVALQLPGSTAVDKSGAGSV